MNRYHL